MKDERFHEPQQDRDRQRHRERRPNPQVDRLRAVIERIIGAPIGDPGQPPTKEIRLRQLEMLLEAEPQRDTSGVLRYLVTSGLAVEMITGFERFHHDIDLVIMDPENQSQWDLMGTDNVTPGEYWADMKFEPAYLEDTARLVRTRESGRSPVAEVVHPAIILVQKSSDAFGRPPREIDKTDVAALVRHWVDKEGYARDWNTVIRHALTTLHADQLDNTLARLKRTVRI